MVARLICRVVLGLLLIAPSAATAQQFLPNGVPAGGAAFPPAMQGMPAPATGMWGPNAPIAAGMQPADYCPPEMMGGGESWMRAPSATSLFIHKVIPNSWVTLESLTWDIGNVGNQLLGAPRTDVDPRSPNLITIIPPLQLANVQFPFAGDLNLEDTPGARFTWGLPLRDGSIELAGWFLGEDSDRLTVNVLRDNNIFTPDPIAATSLGVDNNLNNIVLYDLAYSAEQTTSVWGGELKFFRDWSVPGTDIIFQPMWGFRMTAFDETLRQVGATTINGNRTAVIDSRTENYLFGPQIGARMEFKLWRFTFGADPRIAATFNNFDGVLRVENLRSPGDPSTRQDFDEFKFAPQFEVGAYLKFEVNKYFTLKAGYNFLYLFRVSRPIENIGYNNISLGPNVSALQLSRETTDLHIDGFTIGGEIRFR